MRRRFIIFLTRKKLGLKMGEMFQFTNQRSKEDHYFFTKDKLMKWEYTNGQFELKPANVSFNWMLDPECEIRKMF